MAEKIIPALSFDVLTPLYDLLLELTGYGSRLKKKVLVRAQLRDGQGLLEIKRPGWFSQAGKNITAVPR